MAVEKLHIEQFLVLAKDHPVLDVRSLGEYTHAHIPGAYSLPLFTDEERKIIGTAYKQESREKAIRTGLDFFGPKMRKMVEEVEGICNMQLVIEPSVADPKFPIPNSKIILLYCWRGGMRSSGVAWLMDLYGFKVYTLTGGYKKFRTYVLDTFKLPFNFKMVSGYTGSGKTGILKALKQKAEPVIDLEDIAKHKGSAFGNIGMPEQPGQEMFENLLAQELHALTDGHRQIAGNTANSHPSSANFLWLEDESQRIGLVNLPNDIWNNMRQSPVYFINIPFEERLQYLVKEYGGLDQQQMLDAIGRIRDKLGGLNAKTAAQLLLEGNITESFRILLKYYDKLYLKALHNREAQNSLLYTINCASIIPENANQLTRQPLYQPE